MIRTKTTQTGTLTAGSFGVQVKIKLIPPDGAEFAFDLDDAIAMGIDIQRPDQSTFHRDLDVPGDIVDSANRIVKFTTQSGDTPAGMDGRYEFTLTIDGPPTERIVATGTFSVSP